METILSFDVTIVVCNCNRGKRKAHVYSEYSAVTDDVVNLCMELKKHKRPVIFVAATGEQWGLPEDVAVKWNYMAVQLKAIGDRMGGHVC